MHVEGAVRLAGDADWDRRRLSAYVEQDDALIGVLSVRETLSYAARLGLHRGPGSTPADIKKIVDDAIAELGLRDVADNRIGTPIQRGISGGQKRRVSIGQAIVTRRKILFLDEPTSGLDSATSREVLTSIARSCREQKTIVVATIHQPAWETLTLFNRLLVLSHGSVVFNDITGACPLRPFWTTLTQSSRARQMAVRRRTPGQGPPQPDRRRHGTRQHRLPD